MTIEYDPGAAPVEDGTAPEAIEPAPSDADLTFAQARGYAGLGTTPTDTTTYERTGPDLEMATKSQQPEWNTGIDWKRYSDQVAQAQNPSTPPSSDDLSGITAVMANHWLNAPMFDPMSGRRIYSTPESEQAYRDAAVPKFLGEHVAEPIAKVVSASGDLTRGGLGNIIAAEAPGSPADLAYKESIRQQGDVGAGAMLTAGRAAFEATPDTLGIKDLAAGFADPLNLLFPGAAEAHGLLSAASPEAARVFRAALESRLVQGGTDAVGAAGRAIHDVGPQAAAALDRLAPAAKRFAAEDTGMARIDLGMLGPDEGSGGGGLNARIAAREAERNPSAAANDAAVAAKGEQAVPGTGGALKAMPEDIAQASADFSKAAESVELGAPPRVDALPEHTDATVVRAARLARSALGDEFDATRAALRLGKEDDAIAAQRLLNDQRPALEDATRRAGVDPTPENVKGTADAVIAHAQERNAAITARDAKALQPRDVGAPTEAPIVRSPTQYDRLIDQMRAAGATDTEISGIVGRDALKAHDTAALTPGAGDAAAAGGRGGESGKPPAPANAEPPPPPEPTSAAAIDEALRRQQTIAAKVAGGRPIKAAADERAAMGDIGMNSRLIKDKAGNDVIVLFDKDGYPTSAVPHELAGVRPPEGTSSWGDAIAQAQADPTSHVGQQVLSAKQRYLQQVAATERAQAQQAVEKLVGKVAGSSVAKDYAEKAATIEQLANKGFDVSSPIVQEAASRLRADQAEEMLRAYNSLIPRLMRGSASAAREVLATPALVKSLMASVDFSMILRQNVFLAAAHPGEVFGNVGTYAKTFGDDNYYKLMESLELNPHYQTAVDHGLITGTGKVGASMNLPLEEAFASKLADRIPVVGNSARAATAYMDKTRLDLLANAIERMDPLKRTEKQIGGMAEVIKILTGRGIVPERADAFVNGLAGFAFSPRLFLSRVEAPFTPLMFAAKGQTEAAKYALDALWKFYAAGAGIIGAAAIASQHIPGLTATMDPLDTNFGRIGYHDTFVDIWSGGQAQVFRTALQAALGEKHLEGKVTPLDGKGIHGDRISVLMRMAQSKEAPWLTATVDAVTGRDFIGNPVTAESMANTYLMPLSIGDVVNAIQADRANGGVGLAGAAMGALTVVGAGVYSRSAKGVPSADWGPGSVVAGLADAAHRATSPMPPRPQPARSAGPTAPGGRALGTAQPTRDASRYLPAPTP